MLKYRMGQLKWSDVYAGFSSVLVAHSDVSALAHLHVGSSAPDDVTSYPGSPHASASPAERPLSVVLKR